jgi:biotin carboxylase
VEGTRAPAGKRLLVLGAGPAQLGLLAAARERGLFVIAVDRDPAAPGFEYADRRAIISTEDERGIERLAEAERVDGLISPGTDWPVAIAARVAEKLRLRHPLSPSVAVLATSKLKQRQRFDEAGVPQPQWRTMTDPNESVEVPCVVKAPDRQGQQGLTLVRTTGEAREAIEAAIAESRSGTAIVEEVVEGPEVTVNAFSVGGRFFPLTVTDRHTADPPAFGVALAHVWPSTSSWKKAARVARSAADALGITDGPTYTQLRIGPDGPQVIELAARLGGGHDAELVRAVVGSDLNGAALGAALGEHVAAPEPSNDVGGGIVRFLVPPEGELVAVEGIDEARSQDGVLDIRVYRRPGHVFGPFRRGADRAGAVLAVGESREEALERADRAAALIRFEVGDRSLV